VGSETREPGALTPEAEALVGIAREAAAKAGQAEAMTGLSALHVRLVRRRLRPPARVWIGVAAAAAVLVVIGASLSRYATGPALSFQVDGGEVKDGYVESAGAAGSRLAFSDGSVLTLAKGTRLHIHSTEARGGRFALEDGQVQVDVAHRTGSDWRFYAGPFLVEVKGTAFDLRWKSTSQRLDLRLLRGAVVVRGPVSAQPIALHANQKLFISVPDKRVVVQDLDAMPEADEALQAAAASPAPALGQAGPAGVQPVPSPSAVRRAPSWAAELAAGRAAAILEEVDQLGLEPSVAGRSAEDLAALADAARYKGRPEIALRALSTLRRRFLKSNAGVDAAFHLGRLEEGAHPDEAIRWYDRYLQEASRGPYLQEALGRKMTTVQRLYGTAKARPVADTYLDRYPSGAYASAAKAIMREP